jgi:NhaP-type Na+/H+ or K+/H+ antiporter
MMTEIVVYTGKALNSGYGLFQIDGIDHQVVIIVFGFIIFSLILDGIAQQWHIKQFDAEDPEDRGIFDFINDEVGFTGEVHQ